MLRLLLSLLAVAFVTPPALAQAQPAAGDWDSLNPGAGGQIQEIALDPLVPDRAYVLSDVEGMYRTDDGGASYRFLPNGLLSIDILGMGIDPVDTDRVYLGTDLGLQTSDDAGETWVEHPDVIRSSNSTLITANVGNSVSAKLHISPVVVDPTNADRVAAGLGNKRGSSVFRATVFWSDDRGQTFQPARFGGNGDRNGNENILQLAAGGGLLFAAAETAGVWMSPDFGQTWTQVPTPTGADQLAEGVAVTPDGGTVYAAFRRPNSRGNRIFAARITDGVVGSWTLILGEDYPTNDNTEVQSPQFPNADYRALAIDPRSTADQHALLAAEDNWRSGLFQVTIDWTSGSPAARWENVFYYPDRAGAPFDIGYESNYPRPLSFFYTPVSWGGRGIWTTGDQTLFKVDTETENWTETWESIYTSDPVQTFGDGLQTYADLGWVSTVDFDADQYLNAACSSKADHGIAMSWDSGYSWELDSSPRRPRSNTCRFIATPSGALYVIGHLTDGYGAQPDGGEIWGARLDPGMPGPASWLFLAGGDGQYGSPSGLPDHRIDYIEQNPHNPAQVALSVRDEPRGTGSPGGVYVIDDIDAMFAAREARTAAPSLYRIGGSGAPDAPTEKDNSVRYDPNAEGVMYVGNRNSMLKGTRTPAGWIWAPVCQSERPMKMNVWDRDGQTMLACKRVLSGREWVQVSADGGQSWREAFDLDGLLDAGSTPFDEDRGAMEIWNVAGVGGKMFINVQQNGGGMIGFGIFQADVEADGSTTGLTDVTGPVYQPRAIRMRAYEENGRQWLFLASWGAGTWRRYVGPSSVDGLGALPWNERFSAPDGTTEDGLPPSRWTTTTFGGSAQVVNGQLECRQAEWQSGAIRVSDVSDVTLSFAVGGSGSVQVEMLLDGTRQSLSNQADGPGLFRAALATQEAERAEVVIRCPSEDDTITLDDVRVAVGRVSILGVGADATADEAQPTTALGSEPDLLVRQSSQARYAYVRFSLDGLDGVRVERAALSLTQTNDTEVTITAYPTDAAWDEGALTFDTRPADTGGPVASAQTPGREGGALVLDVTEAVRAAMGGTLSLRLEGERSAALFGSREGGSGPTLELALLDASTAVDLPVANGGLRLGPPVPNPSRDAAVVHYELDATAEVRLALYDARGRRLRVLEEGQRMAGEHRVRIDVSGLSAGVYVYRLEAGGAVASGTAVVLR